HYNHMLDPGSMAPGSIMPSYPWLLEDQLDANSTMSKIKAMIRLGVPYPEGYENQALNDMELQAATITENLKKDGITTQSDREIVALIAYLQRLGKDIKAEKLKAEK
ncbi:MAG: cbb3-type cytochrome c oxidase subunit II, partial [Bacteroidia bacterium]